MPGILCVVCEKHPSCELGRGAEMLKGAGRAIRARLGRRARTSVPRELKERSRDTSWQPVRASTTACRPGRAQCACAYGDVSLVCFRAEMLRPGRVSCSSATSSKRRTTSWAIRPIAPLASIQPNPLYNTRVAQAGLRSHPCACTEDARDSFMRMAQSVGEQKGTHSLDGGARLPEAPLRRDTITRGLRRARAYRKQRRTLTE